MFHSSSCKTSLYSGPRLPYWSPATNDKVSSTNFSIDGAKMLTKIFGAASALALMAVMSGTAQAEPIKFEFWHGLSGDLGDRVQEACTKFNGMQTEYEINCVSQAATTPTCRTRSPPIGPRSTPRSPRSTTPATLD